MKRLLAAVAFLVLATGSAAAPHNPTINLTGLVAPGFWSFTFISYSSDTPNLSAEQIARGGPMSGGVICVRDSFLRDALNWSDEPADDAPFRKKAISATLAGNHLHIDWAPKPGSHVDRAREDVYFDDPTHMHGMQVARAWHGTEFEHFGFTRLKAHRMAEHCLGPEKPSELWRLFAFPGY